MRSIVASFSEKSLTTIYLLALGLIAGLITLSHYWAERSLMSAEDSAKVINIAGKQRMLSQRVSLLLMRANATISTHRNQKLFESLDRALALMERSHQGLIIGDIQQQLPTQTSDATHAYYFSSPHNLDREVKAFIGYVRELSQQVQTQQQPLTLAKLQQLEQKSEHLLPLLNGYVSLLQAEAEDRIQTIERNSRYLMLTALLLLVLEGLFIFRPLMHTIAEYIQVIERHKQQLQQIANARQHFLRNISHLLRTPLNHVIGFSRYLHTRGAEGLKTRQKEAVSSIYAGGLELKDHVEDIFTLTELQKNDTSSKAQRATVAHLERCFQESNITLEKSADCESKALTQLQTSHLDILIKVLKQQANTETAVVADLNYRHQPSGNGYKLCIDILSKNAIGDVDAQHKSAKQLLLEGILEWYGGDSHSQQKDGHHQIHYSVYC